MSPSRALIGTGMISNAAYRAAGGSCPLMRAPIPCMSLPTPATVLHPTKRPASHAASKAVAPSFRALLIRNHGPRN